MARDYPSRPVFFLFTLPCCSSFSRSHFLTKTWGKKTLRKRYNNKKHETVVSVRARRQPDLKGGRHEHHPAGLLARDVQARGGQRLHAAGNLLLRAGGGQARDPATVAHLGNQPGGEAGRGEGGGREGVAAASVGYLQRETRVTGGVHGECD